MHMLIIELVVNYNNLARQNNGCDYDKLRLVLESLHGGAHPYQ